MPRHGDADVAARVAKAVLASRRVGARAVCDPDVDPLDMLSDLRKDIHVGKVHHGLRRLASVVLLTHDMQHRDCVNELTAPDKAALQRLFDHTEPDTAHLSTAASKSYLELCKGLAFPGPDDQQQYGKSHPRTVAQFRIIHQMLQPASPYMQVYDDVCTALGKGQSGLTIGRMMEHAAFQDARDGFSDDVQWFIEHELLRSDVSSADALHHVRTQHRQRLDSVVQAMGKLQACSQAFDQQWMLVGVSATGDATVAFPDGRICSQVSQEQLSETVRQELRCLARPPAPEDQSLEEGAASWDPWKPAGQGDDKLHATFITLYLLAENNLDMVTTKDVLYSLVPACRPMFEHCKQEKWNPTKCWRNQLVRLGMWQEILAAVRRRYFPVFQCPADFDADRTPAVLWGRVFPSPAGSNTGAPGNDLQARDDAGDDSLALAPWMDQDVCDTRQAVRSMIKRIAKHRLYDATRHDLTTVRHDLLDMQRKCLSDVRLATMQQEVDAKAVPLCLGLVKLDTPETWSLFPADVFRFFQRFQAIPADCRQVAPRSTHDATAKKTGRGSGRPTDEASGQSSGSKRAKRADSPRPAAASGPRGKPDADREAKLASPADTKKGKASGRPTNEASGHASTSKRAKTEASTRPAAARGPRGKPALDREATLASPADANRNPPPLPATFKDIPQPLRVASLVKPATWTHADGVLSQSMFALATVYSTCQQSDPAVGVYADTHHVGDDRQQIVFIRTQEGLGRKQRDATKTLLQTVLCDAREGASDQAELRIPVSKLVVTSESLPQHAPVLPGEHVLVDGDLYCPQAHIPLSKVDTLPDRVVFLDQAVAHKGLGSARLALADSPSSRPEVEIKIHIPLPKVLVTDEVGRQRRIAELARPLRSILGYYELPACGCAGNTNVLQCDNDHCPAKKDGVFPDVSTQLRPCGTLISRLQHDSASSEARLTSVQSRFQDSLLPTPVSTTLVSKNKSAEQHDDRSLHARLRGEVHGPAGCGVAVLQRKSFPSDIDDMFEIVSGQVADLAQEKLVSDAVAAAQSQPLFQWTGSESRRKQAQVMANNLWPAGIVGPLKETDVSRLVPDDMSFKKLLVDTHEHGKHTPHEVFSPSRRILHANGMKDHPQLQVRQLRDSLTQLCSTMSSWVHTGSSQLEDGYSFAREVDDFSLLMAVEVKRDAPYYYRPSVLAAWGYRVVDAGHGGKCNCLFLSILLSTVIQARVVGRPLPQFLQATGIDNTGWNQLVINHASVKHCLEPLACVLREETRLWLESNGAALCSQIQAFNTVANAIAHTTLPITEDEIAREIALTDEIEKLKRNRFLGELSMTAFVSVLHQKDSEWFKDWPIVMYGTHAGYTGDRFLEILPLSVSTLDSRAPHLLALDGLCSKNSTGTPKALRNRKVCRDLNTGLPSCPFPVERLKAMQCSIFCNAVPNVHFEAIVFVGAEAPVKYNAPSETIVGLNILAGMSYVTGLPRFSPTSLAGTDPSEFLQASGLYSGRSDPVTAAALLADKLTLQQGAARHVHWGQQSSALPEELSSHVSSPAAWHGFDYITHPDSRDQADMKSLQDDRIEVTMISIQFDMAVKLMQGSKRYESRGDVWGRALWRAAAVSAEVGLVMVHVSGNPDGWESITARSPGLDDGIQGRVVSGHVCFLLVLGPPISKNSILAAAGAERGRTVTPSDFFCANVPWWFPVLRVVPLMHPYATMGTQSVACTPVSVCDFYDSHIAVAGSNAQAIKNLVDSGRVSHLILEMCEENTKHMRMRVVGRRQ